MTSWRDDHRFRCPDCKRLIYLTVAEPDEHPGTTCTVKGICIDCQHIFTGEEWRSRHVLHDPPGNAESRPGTR